MSTAAHPHPRNLVHHFRDLAQQKEAAGLGMWAFIAQEIMFFGGLFLAYAIYRSQYPDVFAAASHHLNLRLGLFNTVVLICSSLTMAMAVHAAAIGQNRRAVNFLLLTVLLGGIFLGVKVVEYKEKFDHHLVPGPRFSAHELKLHGGQERQAQLYYSLYFMMTGLHALHMIIGIPIILWIARRAQRADFTPDYFSPVELTGLYWHFVDIIWIFLFPLLYLIS